MASIKVSEGQSLFDVAIQSCGSAEAAFALAVENGLSISDELAAGQEIHYSTIVNRDIAGYFADKGLKPATALTADDSNNLEGIGYWSIGADFIIS